MLYWFFKAIGAVLVRLIFFLTCKKKDDLPKKGSCIIAANHISLIDPVFIGLCIRRKIFYMAKSEIFEKNKLATALLNHLGVFPVHRGTRDIAAVRTSLEIINQGRVLGIFPEGRRVTSDMGEVRIKKGVAMFAYRTHCPVLPVSVCTKNNKVKAFRKVTVVFGEMLTYEKLGFTDGSPEDLQRVSNLIMEKIKELAIKEKKCRK